MTENKHKNYLGDGAFVEVGLSIDEICISTEDGMCTTNKVVLGRSELYVLLHWLKDNGFITSLEGIKSWVR